MNTKTYFFSDGIRFTCQDCGACCTGAPGTVRISEAEITALAEHLDQSPQQVKATYLASDGQAWRVREKEDGDCVFFNGRCTIYAARPSQCRTYPFWARNMASETAWRKTAKACPGIGQGHLHNEPEILARLRENMTEMERYRHLRQTSPATERLNTAGRYRRLNHSCPTKTAL